ncbi:MAG: DUF2326 domain-containing protein [Chloroflexi bacterium]|nr:DUF2326 domain-containing protein [Chloroflexota bacterium]
MISQVEANIHTFRSVKFTEGFNVVVADRTTESAERDTRNGLGKTLLLDIIRFCLGEDKQNLAVLRAGELRELEFTLALDRDNSVLSLTRSIKRPGKVAVHTVSDWFDEYIGSSNVIQSSNKNLLLDSLPESHNMSIEDLRQSLGKAWYALQPESDVKYHPEFGDTLKYEIRRDVFDDPFKCKENQFGRSIHLCNTFLLDLDWRLASQWQELAQLESEVRNKKRSLQDNIEGLPLDSTTLGELEAERDRLQNQVDSFAAQLNSFEVHPQYAEIENEANDLTGKIHDLKNRAVQLKRLIAFHERSIALDEPAADSRVIELYEAAGAQLPAMTAKRLKDVQAFHVQITRNRREFLRDERQRLEQELDANGQQTEVLSNRRAELLAVINTHGAIDEYAKLTQLYRERDDRLKAITERIETLKLVDEEIGSISTERIQLQAQARRDLDQSETIKLARRIFSSNSEALYKTPGNLIVDIDLDKGYQFRVDIRRSGSTGINKMKTFFYDLTRAELLSQRRLGPGFLIHDSSMFADADERQVARALELAERKSRECGFQYIACLNSDQVLHDEFSKSFEIDSYVRLRLTDDSPAGSLLGMRF